MQHFPRLALGLIFLFILAPAGMRADDAPASSPPSNDVQLTISPSGISHLLTGSLNTLLTDPRQWDPPREYVPYNPIEALKKMANEKWGHYEFPLENAVSSIPGLSKMDLPTIGLDINYTDLEFGEIKFNYIAQDKSFQLCLPIKKLQVELDASGNEQKFIKNLALKLHTGDRFCFKAAFQQVIDRATLKPKMILQLEQPNFDVGRYNVVIEASVYEGDQDLLATTAQCLRELEQCLDWNERALTDRNRRDQTQAASSNQAAVTDPQQIPLCQKDGATSAKAIKQAPADFPYRILDNYCTITKEELVKRDDLHELSEDQKWIKQNYRAVSDCLTPLGSHLLKDPTKNLPWWLKWLKLYHSPNVTTRVSDYVHPSCALISMINGLNGVSPLSQTRFTDPYLQMALQFIASKPQNGIRPDPHSVQNILQQWLFDMLNNSLAKNDAINNAISMLGAPISSQMHLPTFDEYFQSSNLRDFQASINKNFSIFNDFAENAELICKEDSLKTVQNYHQAISSLVNGINPKIDSDDANEILNLHANTIEKLIRQINDCPRHDPLLNAKIAQLNKDLGQLRHDIAGKRSDLQTARNKALQDSTAVSRDFDFSLINNILPDFPQVAARGGDAPNCPPSSAAQATTSLNFQIATDSTPQDVALTIPYAALNERLRAFFNGPTICLPSIDPEHPLENSESEFNFNSCYPPEKKLHCSFAKGHAPYLCQQCFIPSKATEEDRNAAKAHPSLQLVFPSIDCYKGAGENAAKVLTMPQISLDLWPQIRPTEDGEKDFYFGKGKLNLSQVVLYADQLGVSPNQLIAHVTKYLTQPLAKTSHTFVKDAAKFLTGQMANMPWFEIQSLDYNETGITVKANKRASTAPSYEVLQLASGLIRPHPQSGQVE